MATDQYLMAEGTCLKVAPLTENGNNCPTSEQAPNCTPKELWPPFLGSERVRERYASNLADVPACIASVSARGETPPAKTASIPSVHPAYILRSQSRDAYEVRRCTTANGLGHGFRFGGHERRIGTCSSLRSNLA